MCEKKYQPALIILPKAILFFCDRFTENLGEYEVELHSVSNPTFRLRFCCLCMFYRKSMKRLSPVNITNYKKLLCH